jgi:hypothetical protein
MSLPYSVGPSLGSSAVPWTPANAPPTPVFSNLQQPRMKSETDISMKPQLPIFIHSITFLYYEVVHLYILSFWKSSRIIISYSLIIIFTVFQVAPSIPEINPVVDPTYVNFYNQKLQAVRQEVGFEMQTLKLHEVMNEIVEDDGGGVPAARSPQSAAAGDSRRKYDGTIDTRW